MDEDQYGGVAKGVCVWTSLPTWLRILQELKVFPQFIRLTKANQQYKLQINKG